MLEIGDVVAPGESYSKISAALCRLLRADSAKFQHGNLMIRKEAADGRRVLAAVVSSVDNKAFSIVVKRTRGHFRAHERALFRQVIPHVRQACRNALALSAIVRTSDLPATRVGNLTSREQEVLRWICAGKRNAEVATILDVSPRTVEKHLEHVFAKLGVETRTAAVHEALELTAAARG